ncbi:MAG: VTT domain-containing protein [Sphaerochaeta sp.]|jgi:uncharacterized membrane protein YdjX (TVP38/TMEM64 family)|nr:VTT domain-containing protein [Sphaerochaeta sp.]
MQDDSKIPRAVKVLRAAPLVLVVALATTVVLRSGPTAIRSYIESYRENAALTALVILALFLFKSVSFGLPYTVLYLAVGHLFTLPIALALNIIGIAVNMQIPYFLGRYGNVAFIERLLHRARFVRDFSQRDDNHPLIFSFLVKFIGVVPHEITNLLLGSLDIPYGRYLVGGILGLLPGMVTTTVAGASMADPTSIQFILAVLAFALVMALSYYLSRRTRKK